MIFFRFFWRATDWVATILLLLLLLLLSLLPLMCLKYRSYPLYEETVLSQKLFFVPQLSSFALPSSISALIVFHTSFIHCTKRNFFYAYTKKAALSR